MLRYLKLLSFLSFFMLTSCTYIYGEKGIIQDRGTDYLKAWSIPPLQIPPGIASSTIEAHYPVSDQCYPQSLKRISLTPPELYNPIYYTQQPIPAPLPVPSRLCQPRPVATTTSFRTPRFYTDTFTRSTSPYHAGTTVGSIARSVNSTQAIAYPFSSSRRTQLFAQNNRDNSLDQKQKQRQTNRYYVDRFARR